MAGNKIRVNTNSLDQTRSEIQSRLDKIQKDIEQISANMATLSSMWEGDAHTAFHGAVTDDIQFLTEACNGIKGIVNFEDNAVSEYNKCERQVADIISQIRI